MWLRVVSTGFASGSAGGGFQADALAYNGFILGSIMSTDSPEAAFCLSSHCPHCPAMVQMLTEMVKQGVLARLDVVNIEILPDQAREWGVRSVPWLRIGDLELTGLRPREAVMTLIERATRPAGMADYFHDLLKDGELSQVLAVTQRKPEHLVALLPIVANPEASINVRIGAGACFEEFAGQPALRSLVRPLCDLAGHADARVRADACHYLGLAGDAGARACLMQRLDDEDAEVREIAKESLAALAETGQVI